MMKSCRHFEQDLSLMAVGLLTEEETPMVEQHLAGCPECQQRLQELHVLTQAMVRLKEELSPVAPSAKLRPRWRREILGRSNRDRGVTVDRLLVIAYQWVVTQRRAISALTAIWLLIVFFHATAPRTPEVVSLSPPPTPRDILTALRRQTEGMFQITEAVPVQPVPATKPRSDGRTNPSTT